MKNKNDIQNIYALFLLNPRFTLSCMMLFLLFFVTGCRGEYVTETRLTREKDGNYNNFFAGGDAGFVHANVIGGWASYTYWKDNYRNLDSERMNLFKDVEEQLKLGCGDAKISLKEKECSPPNGCDSRIICR